MPLCFLWEGESNFPGHHTGINFATEKKGAALSTETDLLIWCFFVIKTQETRFKNSLTCWCQCSQSASYVSRKEKRCGSFHRLSNQRSPSRCHTHTHTNTHTYTSAYYINTCVRVYNDAKLQWLTETMLGSASAPASDSAALSNDSRSKWICHGNHWPVCICPELKHQDFSFTVKSFMELIGQRTVRTDLMPLHGTKTCKKCKKC